VQTTGGIFYHLSSSPNDPEREAAELMAKAPVSRFGVSIPPNLLEEFDRYIHARQYSNRSEAIRDLIRDRLVERDWQGSSGTVVASLTIIYDHHVPELSQKLTAIQHDYHKEVVSAMHVHLSHELCMEVLALRGKRRQLTELADRLLATRGVYHGRLVQTSPAALEQERTVGHSQR
jgi:CopG family nickel-responsive transcriptional regulator